MGKLDVTVWRTGDSGTGDDAATDCGGELGGVNCVKIEEAFRFANPKWLMFIGASTLITWFGLVIELSSEFSNNWDGE